MRRPVGLTLFALRYVVGGAMGFLAVTLTVLLGSLEVKFVIELMLISLLWVILGIGLWNMRNWGRWASIIFTLGGFLTQIVFAAFLPLAFGLSWRHMKLAVPHNIIDVAMVIYLLTPRVRQLFLSANAEARL